MPHQDRSQSDVDVVVPPSPLLFHQEPILGELVQVARCCGARHLQVLLHIFDPRVGVSEQVVDEVLAVEPVLRPDAVLVVLKRLLDGTDGLDAFGGGVLHHVQHVEHPVLPGVLFPHGLQQPVILSLGLNDPAAQIQHGDVQQALFHEVKDIQDAPRAAVPVIERMDALELMVDQTHLDERVHLEGNLSVDELLQITHEPLHVLLILGWQVDHRTRSVFQRSAGQLPETRAILLQHFLNLKDVVLREQPSFLDQGEPPAQGKAVSQDFLGRRIICVLGRVIALEQFIMGGDDVLDLRAVLRLLQAESVDEDSLIRDRGRHAFQFRKAAAGARQFLQNPRRIEASRVQVFQRIECSHVRFQG